MNAIAIAAIVSFVIVCFGGSGFNVLGVGFSRSRIALEILRLSVRVESLGCGVAWVSGIEIRVSDSDSGFEFWVLGGARLGEDAGKRREGQSCQSVSGVGFRVWAAVFGVSGLGARLGEGAKERREGGECEEKQEQRARVRPE
jgi:hypothetical protein